MNVINYIMITCNLKNGWLQITSDYMKKYNRLQLITFTPYLVPHHSLKFWHWSMLYLSNWTIFVMNKSGNSHTGSQKFLIVNRSQYHRNTEIYANSNCQLSCFLQQNFMNRDFSQTAGSLYCLLSGRHIFVSALQEHATIFASKFLVIM